MSKVDTKIKLALSVSKTLLLICNQISYELVRYNILKNKTKQNWIIFQDCVGQLNSKL